MAKLCRKLKWLLFFWDTKSRPIVAVKIMKIGRHMRPGYGKWQLALFWDTAVLRLGHILVRIIKYEICMISVQGLLRRRHYQRTTVN